MVLVMVMVEIGECGVDGDVVRRGEFVLWVEGEGDVVFRLRLRFEYVSVIFVPRAIFIYS